MKSLEANLKLCKIPMKTTSEFNLATQEKTNEEIQYFKTSIFPHANLHIQYDIN